MAAAADMAPTANRKMLAHTEGHSDAMCMATALSNAVNSSGMTKDEARHRDRRPMRAWRAAATPHWLAALEGAPARRHPHLTARVGYLLFLTTAFPPKPQVMMSEAFYGTCDGASLMMALAGVCKADGADACAMMPACTFADNTCSLDITKVSVTALASLVASKDNAEAIAALDGECMKAAASEADCAAVGASAAAAAAVTA
jgi:hypothetical protein